MNKTFEAIKIAKEYESFVPDFMRDDASQNSILYGKFLKFKIKIYFYLSSLESINVVELERRVRLNKRMSRELARDYMKSVWHHHRFVDVYSECLTRVNHIIDKYDLPEGDY
jgi:hypothetical protein